MLAFQFFITMGETPELNNKHTLFGKVVGHTVYNMIKLQDGELEDDRPVRPHKIVRTKVLINPFPDIEPRKLIKVVNFRIKKNIQPHLNVSLLFGLDSNKVLSISSLLRLFKFKLAFYHEKGQNRP